MSMTAVLTLDLGDFNEATLWKDDDDGGYAFSADLMERYDNKEMARLAKFLRKCADKIERDLKKWEAK